MGNKLRRNNANLWFHCYRDIKFFSNLNVESWEEPFLYMPTWGKQISEIEYYMDANIYGIIIIFTLILFYFVDHIRKFYGAFLRT
jgi:hypothetical protein